MPKILFIAAHRKDRSPSQRFRFEQYFEFLEKNGFEVEFLPLLTEEDDKILYSKGKYFEKSRLLLRCIERRKKDLKKAESADIIFIQREAFLTRSVRFEKGFKSLGKKMVFDFDDSIWLSNVSDANKKFNWLKNPGKTSQIIEMSDMIFAGNAYLSEYASKFNKNVFIVPTTIDTNEYVRIPPVKNSDKICIGWSGSITTIQHFEFAVPFLREIKKKYGDLIEIKVIGDGNYVNEELGVKGLPWNKATEIKELSTFDIGIMPLPDDEWAKGKCGLKGLQYMALEIPAIMSPVGVNSEIIQHGENGFLATTTDEWVSAISELTESMEKRNAVGMAARKTVETKYSVEANKKVYLELLNRCIGKK
jgi:glycosyltransferase involved in cell wall biosynthesis